MNNLKKITLTLTLLSFLLSCKDFNNKEISQNILPEQLKNEALDRQTKNDFNYLPTSTSHQIIVHNNYTLSYVEKYEQAEWVAYLLNASTTNNHFKRPFFIEDPKVTTGSADWKNYKKSGYDKGHLCPAGDMKFSEQAYDDTFFTSNISPQTHEFNDGVWNRLEEKVRYWSIKLNGIYVVTGGVLQDGLKTIGRENVAVPNYFYKVLLYKKGSTVKMIGFLVPSQDSNLPLYKFVVPVDKIEQMTGIDFYPKLEDSIENQLEKNSDYKDWSF